MQIEISQSSELLTNRCGLLQVQAFLNHHKIAELVDEHLPQSNSNHSYKASAFTTSLLHMFLDGATTLEEVNMLKADKAFRQVAGLVAIPSSDAIGDWLRRVGKQNAEEKILRVNQILFSRVSGDKFTLDIDGTIIEADKGDAQKSYKGIVGYHPLLGIIAENNIAVHIEFRTGNQSPQGGLVKFIEQCFLSSGNRIACVRSGSAGYQKDVIKSIVKAGKFYSITAKHTEPVMEAIATIPEIEWRRGYDDHGCATLFEVAETSLAFIGKKHTSRLLVKRTRREGQIEAFDQHPYTYWAVITNLPVESFPLQKALGFHQQRGRMEKSIGEIKEHFNLGHLPCGQFHANSSFFALGILGYNIIQMMKMSVHWQSVEHASIKTIRYKLLHVAGKLVSHSNKLFLKIATMNEYVDIIRNTYLHYQLSPV